MGAMFKKPKMPAAPKPIAMADPMATAGAKRKAVIDQSARKGRSSTVLSQKDTLGG